IFNKATEHMSKSQYITLSSSISIYNVLLGYLEKILDTKSNYCLEIRTAVLKGYEKLKKYYIKTDKSYVYSIAISKIKLQYYQIQECEQEYIDAVLEAVTNIYNKNYKHNLPIIIDNEVDNPNDFLVNVFEKSNKINKDKLEDYLQKPVISFKTDPLQW
ncbi:7840_t:CDS:2, partial [Funneliformis caledonium]